MQERLSLHLHNRLVRILRTAHRGVEMSENKAHRVTGAWRKSSFSGPSGGNCVELAEATDGHVALRNSRDPEGPVVFYTRPEIDAFVRGAKAGEFDDLTN
ncbi:DUF397 domain-containing protein [Nocardia higoensis]|uniref:DUF397 domain-containing protein n=1 Tax=Nocardia higoensis TaxID=228599 RepID=UPI003571524A